MTWKGPAPANAYVPHAHFQGYVIKVVSILDVGQGKIMPGTGLAEFRSRYQAIVLKPVRAGPLTAVQRRSDRRQNHERQQDGILRRSRAAQHICLISSPTYRL